VTTVIRIADHRKPAGTSLVVFAMRATGREIAEQAPAGPVRLDFSGVEAITNCFADELLARLGDRDLSIVGCNEEIHEAFEIVLERRRISTAILGGDR
jgi:hypothetical protein